MAGCPRCAVDLVRANPHKPTIVYPNGFVTFRELYVGETLYLPDKWFDGTLDRLPQSYFQSLPDASGQLAANGKAAPPRSTVTGGPSTAGATYGGAQTGAAKAGDTVTFQSGHRYRITANTSIARSALTAMQVKAIANWIDSLGLDGNTANVSAEQPDANTSAVVLDYTGPLLAVKLPDSPLPDVAQMTVEDLGAAPPAAPGGMSAGAKVAVGVVAVALAGGLAWMFLAK